MKYWDMDMTVTIPTPVTRDRVKVGSKVWIKWSERAKRQGDWYVDRWGEVIEVCQSDTLAIIVQFDHCKHWFHADGAFGGNKEFAQLYLEKC